MNPSFFNSFGDSDVSQGSTVDLLDKQHHHPSEDHFKEVNTSCVTIKSCRSHFETDLSRKKTEKSLSSVTQSRPKLMSLGSSVSLQPQDAEESNIYHFLCGQNYKALRSLDFNSAFFLANLIADHTRVPSRDGHPRHSEKPPAPLQQGDYFLEKIDSTSQLTDKQFQIISSKEGKAFQEKKLVRKKADAEPRLPTIVIDLFNTLVYCVMRRDKQTNKKKMAVYQRPHLEFFLKNLEGKARLVVYSFCDQKDVRKVVKHIDPREQYFARVMTKDDCVISKDNKLLKSFDTLDGRDNLLFIDQKFVNYAAPVASFVPVKAYDKKNPKDQELLKLSEYLDELLAKSTVAPLPVLNEQHLHFEKFLHTFNLKNPT